MCKVTFGQWNKYSVWLLSSIFTNRKCEKDDRLHRLRYFHRQNPSLVYLNSVFFLDISFSLSLFYILWISCWTCFSSFVVLLLWCDCRLTFHNIFDSNSRPIEKSFTIKSNQNEMWTLSFFRNHSDRCTYNVPFILYSSFGAVSSIGHISFKYTGYQGMPWYICQCC